MAAHNTHTHTHSVYAIYSSYLYFFCLSVSQSFSLCRSFIFVFDLCAHLVHIFSLVDRMCLYERTNHSILLLFFFCLFFFLLFRDQSIVCDINTIINQIPLNLFERLGIKAEIKELITMFYIEIDSWNDSKSRIIQSVINQSDYQYGKMIRAINCTEKCVSFQNDSFW